MRSQVCIDANVVVRSLIPGQFTENVLALFEEWDRARVVRIAPALLAFEVSSTLRRLVYLKEISSDEGEEAFQNFLSINIRLSHRRAMFPLAWRLAHEFQRPRTYDTAYLALAQLRQCDFWTADARLYNAVGARLSWVRWVGDFTPTPP
jgi:predicted nucleic acid-binding protein